MSKKTSSTKFILFIDLRQAYDSVNHRRLLEKLEKLETPQRITDTIRKLLYYASIRMDMEGVKVLVNRREIQGSMLSPDLFNVNINDLIDLLEKAVLKSLSNADDLAVLCDGEEKFNEAMVIIEAWCGDNDIAVNKKKS